VDVRETDIFRENAVVRARLELRGIRTWLTVALQKEGVLQGVINVSRHTVRPFSDKQIALLQNFAAQAVIAIENARLLTETREALEQQTATAEVLQVINSSLGDLAPVFDAMLVKALRLCDASYGNLLTYDGVQFRVVGAVHADGRIVEQQRSRPPFQVGEGLLQRMVQGDDLEFVEDVRDTGSYRLDRPFREMVDSGTYRSLLNVGLRKEGVLVGVIGIFRNEVRPFSDKETALLQNFAAQAVIAMENARLLTETREALEQQTATAEVLQVINSSPGDLAPVFGAMLEKAMALCEAAFGILFIYTSADLRAAATRGLPTQLDDYMRAGIPLNPDSEMNRGAEIQHIADLTQIPLTKRPALTAAVELGGARTMLNVALRKDGTRLGFFSIYRQEIRPFTDKQIALLQNFAAQAVIAIENARLLTETHEALEQQTATAEVLGVINSSPGNLAPVFDAMLEKAMRLCGAAFGELLTYDGERFRDVATRGVPTAFTEYRRHGNAPPGPGSLGARVLAGERVIHVTDLKSEEVYRAGDANRRALVDLGGARAALAASLRKDDVVLGFMILYRQDVQPFADKQVALLENFAAQAVIAMENARLLGELRRRTDDLTESLEYQTATSDVLQVISHSTFDLQPVLGALVETAARLCNAEMGFVLRRDGDEYLGVANVGYPPDYEALIRSMSFTPGRGSVAMRAVLERGIVHVPDVADDPEYAVPETVSLAKVHTVLGVPLIRESESVGVIVLARQRVEPFTERQIELVRTFADQAVIAMENARLIGELHERTDQVAELNRGLEARVAEQVEELGRVGRLKRFLAPQLAELIVSQGDEKILESHRREIVVVFCDLRGYTAFTETAEPEEVLEFLREYHGALGPLVSEFEGTLDQFSGDGIMVFFNDPVPCPDPAERAVKMAMAMREAAGKLIADWRERGRDLGFGAGIAQGFATLGQIGFSDRSGYTAIGTVCNVAARLCAEAKDNQIFLSQRVNAALKGSVVTEQVGALALKGLSQPVVTYNVPLAAAQPTLRVIEGGPQSV
jgi:GAF domain-containing protein